jgi:hypothetical protein
MLTRPVITARAEASTFAGVGAHELLQDRLWPAHSWRGQARPVMRRYDPKYPKLTPSSARGGCRALCRVAAKSGYPFHQLSPANPPYWFADGHIHLAEATVDSALARVGTVDVVVSAC